MKTLRLDADILKTARMEVSVRQFYLVPADGTEYRDPDKMIEIRPGNRFETKKRTDSRTSTNTYTVNAAIPAKVADFGGRHAGEVALPTGGCRDVRPLLRLNADMVTDYPVFPEEPALAYPVTAAGREVSQDIPAAVSERNHRAFLEEVVKLRTFSRKSRLAFACACRNRLRRRCRIRRKCRHRQVREMR